MIFLLNTYHLDWLGTSTFLIINVNNVGNVGNVGTDGTDKRSGEGAFVRTHYLFVVILKTPRYNVFHVLMCSLFDVKHFFVGHKKVVYRGWSQLFFSRKMLDLKKNILSGKKKKLDHPVKEVFKLSSAAKTCVKALINKKG